VLAAPVNADQAQAAPRTGHAPQISASTVRIPAERVDALVRLTGELTVATNALAHLGATAVQDGNPLAAQLRVRQAVFEHLTQELQRSVLALRVMPLRAVFQRFPRLLRGIAEDLGKSIQLKTSGEDTEADKAVVEMLFEPLLHVVRNAADHGVEDGELRAQRHKPPTATIELRASRHGDQVLVEVQDDGGGMDLQAIRTAARGHGVTDDAMDAMTDQQIVDLVFTPGFSTAGAVTHLSGRGVGMDAVQAAIGRLGGSVSIQSRAGEGTTVRFTLPFSIMMTSVMSVQAGGQMFGVPLDYVQEAVRVPRESLSAVGAAQALVLRNQTIPVIELSTMVGDTISRKDTEATIVVACFAGQRCGLEVDKVGERLDIILKPLDGLLAGTPGISGTTLLGDGRVLLVLDIPEMLQ
jgi:two-component system chemotaxis sensor kinase CheA